MCQFFSCNSNGKGKIKFFKVEDIVKEMAKGNPKNYNWNSHTSISDFYGIKGLEEDKWNKWEYNPFKKELKIDQLLVKDDSKKIIPKIEKYLKDKDLIFLQNLYNRNSGNRNSGNRNSGDGNSGDRNSGNGNSGNGNSGDNNSGCIIGHFSSIKQYFLFNKPCTEEQANEVYNLELWRYFYLTEWISPDKMTDKEKEKHPFFQTTDGYLKTYTYQEAWAKVPKEIIEKIKKLANFDKDVSKEITGLEIK